jgi:thiosulfate/3-mercaptopyruvate sulfurtransferase
MVSSPLVSTGWLEDHLADPDLRIIEVCNIRDDKTYREGHIPGAMWFYWKTACWHETDRDFITPAAMADMFGRLGIGPQSTVVLYGDPVQFGSYAFWAFTMAGHAKLRLLDGGRRKWVMEGRPLSQAVPRFSAVPYPAPPAGPSSMRIGRDNVREHLRAPRRLLLDLRSPEEYSGERVSDYSFKTDHGAERTGRIPGAVHLYFKELLNEDDSFKSPEQLRRTLAAAGVAPQQFDEVVCYCRLSHRATIGWLALGQILGLPDVKIYDGSWTEWGSIVGFPIEK